MQAPGADASPRPSLCLLGWRPVSVGVDSPWGQPGPACPLHRRYHQHPPTAAADNITHATSTINLPPLRLYLYRIRCSETNPCSLWGNFFVWIFFHLCLFSWVSGHLQAGDFGGSGLVGLYLPSPPAFFLLRNLCNVGGGPVDGGL